MDGLRAPLLLHSPNETYAAHYDAEFTIVMGDWYHTEHHVLLKHFLSIANPGGAEPIPGELPHPIAPGGILIRANYLGASIVDFRLCRCVFLPKWFIPATYCREQPFPSDKRGRLQRECDPSV